MAFFYGLTPGDWFLYVKKETALKKKLKKVEKRNFQ